MVFVDYFILLMLTIYPYTLASIHSDSPLKVHIWDLDTCYLVKAWYDRNLFEDIVSAGFQQ